jgi:hypothetical protein
VATVDRGAGILKILKLPHDLVQTGVSNVRHGSVPGAPSVRKPHGDCSIVGSLKAQALSLTRIA